jgi:hypothetical protein
MIHIEYSMQILCQYQISNTVGLHKFNHCVMYAYIVSECSRQSIILFMISYAILLVNLLMLHPYNLFRGEEKLTTLGKKDVYLKYINIHIKNKVFHLCLVN